MGGAGRRYWPMSGIVKVCGWRPDGGGAAQHRGPAYANLQGRKPREGDVGRAALTMGIWMRRMRCVIGVGPSQRSGRRGSGSVNERRVALNAVSWRTICGDGWISERALPWPMEEAANAAGRFAGL